MRKQQAGDMRKGHINHLTHTVLKTDKARWIIGYVAKCLDNAKQQAAKKATSQSQSLPPQKSTHNEWHSDSGWYHIAGKKKGGGQRGLIKWRPPERMRNSDRKKIIWSELMK